MPFFSFFSFHSHFYSLTTPRSFASSAPVARSEETMHRRFERKIARQWRFMNRSMAWILPRFVPHLTGFGHSRQSGEEGQAAEQFAALDSKWELQFSNAIDSPQDLPEEGSKVPEVQGSINSKEGLAKESPSLAEFLDLGPFIFGGVWAIESIEQTPKLMLNSWQCFELQLCVGFSLGLHLPSLICAQSRPTYRTP